MKPISFHEACATVKEKLHIELGTEKIRPEEALGRTVSQDIFSSMDNPPFSRSTMDGYAVRSSDTHGASDSSPVTLRITGESIIGVEPPSLESPFSAIRISTGAKIPTGADAVVMVEGTSSEGGENVLVFTQVEKGENIAHRGGDLVKDELIIRAGTVIEIPHIAVMNALGIPEIVVREKLRIGIVSTGNELIRPGIPYTEPKIYDSNGPTIQSLLNSHSGIMADYLGTLHDDRGSIESKLKEFIGKYHIVIVSGGSSAGEYDYVYRVISEFEPGMIFHGVMIKPGMPTAFGQHGGHFIIGLPGFPVSALMVFLSIFLNPVLSLSSSIGETPPITGKMGVSVRVDSLKTNLIPVKILGSSGDSRIYPVKGLSGSVSRFLDTDGYIVVPPRSTSLPEGQEVEVFRFNRRYASTGKVISGLIDSETSEWLKRNSIEYTYRRLPSEDAAAAFGNGSVDGVILEAEESCVPELVSSFRKLFNISSRIISSREILKVTTTPKKSGNAEIIGVTDEFSPWNVLSENGISAELANRIRNSTAIRINAEEAFKKARSGELTEVYTTIHPPEGLSARSAGKISRILLMKE